MLEINLNATFFLICCLPPRAKSNGKPIYLEKPRVGERSAQKQSFIECMRSFCNTLCQLENFKLLMKRGKVEIQNKVKVFLLTFKDFLPTAAVSKPCMTSALSAHPSLKCNFYLFGKLIIIFS